MVSAAFSAFPLSESTTTCNSMSEIVFPEEGESEGDSEGFVGSTTDSNDFIDAERVQEVLPITKKN